MGHSTRYNNNNNEAVDHMIDDIEEEEDKEEEDADRDDRSLNPSSRPRSKISHGQEVIPESSQLPEDVHASGAPLSAPGIPAVDQPDILY
jgi:hypothetical protein